MNELMRFIKDCDGVTAIEYSFICVLIILVCFVALTTVGQNLSDLFQRISTVMN